MVTKKNPKPLRPVPDVRAPSVYGTGAALTELHAKFQERLFLPDPAIVDFVMAVIVANRLPSDPVWGIAVAPPSAGKTEVLHSVRGLPDVVSISTLTPNTLLSGAKDKGPEPKSLLHRIGPTGVLVWKDFGTLLSMREDKRNEIIGQLREVYDGQFTKETGLGSQSWSGKLGFLAAATPALDYFHTVLSVLGERFLYLRLAEAPRMTIAQRALAWEDDTRAFLQAAVSDFLGGIDISDPPELDAETIDRLAHIADLCTMARTGLMRDRYTREIEHMPSPETPARFVKQLASLWKAAELIGHRDSMAFVGRVALDSIPAARAAVLRLLASVDRADTRALSKVAPLGATSRARLREDLEVLGLIEKVEAGTAPGGDEPAKAAVWGMTEEAREKWAFAFNGISAGHSHPASSQGKGEEEVNIRLRGVDAGRARPAETWPTAAAIAAADRDAD